VNRVGIKTDGLSISVVMGSKSGLHVVERGSVIGSMGTVGLITKRRGFRYQSMSSQPLQNLQPRVHQMRTTNALIVEEGIHWNLPKSREFGFAFANSGSRQAVISEAVVQSIRPESVSIFLSDGDGGGSRRVIGELRLVQEFQGIRREVEVRGAETLDRFEWDTGESIESDKVSIDLFNCGRSDVGHPIENHEAMSWWWPSARSGIPGMWHQRPGRFRNVMAPRKPKEGRK